MLRSLLFGSFLPAPGSPAVGGPWGATLHWAVSASETHSVPLSLLLQSQTLICPAPLCSLLMEVLVFQQWPCLLSSEKDMWGRFALLQVTGWKCSLPSLALALLLSGKSRTCPHNSIRHHMTLGHDKYAKQMNEPNDGGDEDDKDHLVLRVLY